MTTIAKIEAARRAVAALEDSYLRRFGWGTTCQTPGSYWLWRRDFAAEDAEMARIHAERKLPSPPPVYGVVTVPKDLAMLMTERDLDHDDEEAED